LNNPQEMMYDMQDMQDIIEPQPLQVSSASSAFQSRCFRQLSAAVLLQQQQQQQQQQPQPKRRRQPAGRGKGKGRGGKGRAPQEHQAPLDAPAGYDELEQVLSKENWLLR
jgi:hypothetical protein